MVIAKKAVTEPEDSKEMFALISYIDKVFQRDHPLKDKENLIVFFKRRVFFFFFALCRSAAKSW